jgi:phosphatidate cytidylyltransferase
MTEWEIGLRACWTVGGLFGFGILVIFALGIARRKRNADALETPTKKVPLWARYATLVGLALALLVPAYVGEAPFAVVVGLLVVLGLREFWGMLAAGHVQAHRKTGYLGALGVVMAAFYAGPTGLGLAVMAAFWVILSVSLFGKDLPSLPARAGGTTLGVLYVGGLAAFFVLLRHGDFGFGRVLFFLMVIQLADVFGLVGGLAFGRRPLAPTISPGKTLEGTLGSAAAAVAGAALFAFAVPLVPLPIALGFGLVLFGVGLVGDLLASGFKRAVGLKDFGALLPGHGGILDRFDGWLLAAPVAWLGLCALAPYLGH